MENKVCLPLMINFLCFLFQIVNCSSEAILIGGGSRF